MTYPINPHRPIHEIVDDFQSLSSQKLKMDLGRSAARAIHDDNPNALLSLALAYCIWRDVRIADDTLDDMAEIMIVYGGRGRVFARDDEQQH